MRIIVPTGFQARAVGREGTLVVRLCMNRLARNIVVGPKKSRFHQTRCVSLINFSASAQSAPGETLQ